jgi:TonB family protein
MKTLMINDWVVTSFFALFALFALSGSASAQTVSGGVLNSKAISLPAPAYPAAARAVRAAGSVTVQVTVSEAGKVISATAVSGHPLLRSAAEEAAKKAEFKPLLRGSAPVKVTGVLSYKFDPSSRSSVSTGVTPTAPVADDPQPENSAPEAEQTSPAPEPEQTTPYGAPSITEIKTMIEQKMSVNYENHFGGNELNKVTFDWLGPVEVVGTDVRGRIPHKCWNVKLDLKVTFEKPSSGEIGSVTRGIQGRPIREMFCIWREDGGALDFVTYQP